MAATVFYVDTVPEPGAVAVLDGAEGRHAATVRRIRAGERLVVSDGAGVMAKATVVAAAKDRLELSIGTKWIAQQPVPRVTLVQALPKSDRAELAVELATEAGIDVIVPWAAARCVSRWDGTKAAKGVAKWCAAARAAARQSRRPYVPEVTELASTATVLELVTQCVERGGIVVALHESASQAFSALPFGDAAEVMLVVGPEGGLDDGELTRLQSVGARVALLGPTVLRTSTAAAVALGALGALTSRWSLGPAATHEDP
ncbi:16S rRNA (uracil(1498)-N(3))-methyltransferase [Skermania sp. ID1734]|uniref:16S rRNA (uracil(1498)-N(3))-methyltransferase n=1 Tax=Skermania sp. ID1734 TaxID=2597516 RepID=UPI00117ED2A0|nr:16S rRNA (uracil(1498)-N(3))-methyltransferase [Skermania sp. ID1734]TSE00055.1 16S rRNA (uracil(1498)-N(3))-methyltransferase [Skermania sp. ID1734]